MNFNDNKPIYRQIVDYACDAILGGRWKAGALIPSVRELSGELGVNPRTILKAMEHLQNAGIIAARRGMGFELTADATDRIRVDRRAEFFDTTLKTLSAEMTRLGLTAADILPYLPS